MNKKRLKKVFIVIVIFVAPVISFYIYRSRFHKNAEMILTNIVASMIKGEGLANYDIEMEYDAKAEDFSLEYVELMRDYTFGSWEFTLEFSNGSRYYFDFSEYEGSVRARVRPSN